MYLLDKVGDLGEKPDKGQFKIGALGSSTSVSGRTSNNNRTEVSSYIDTTDVSLLRGRRSTSFQIRVIIFDSLVSLGVLVCGQDERIPLSFKNLFGSSDRRVNEGSDLESWTELVFESERVAVC